MRDLEWWTNESQKKLVYDKIKSAVSARMGAATDEGFNKMIQGYRDRIAEIEGKHPETDRIASSWEELKSKGKG